VGVVKGRIEVTGSVRSSVEQRRNIFTKLNNWRFITKRRILCYSRKYFRFSYDWLT